MSRPIKFISLFLALILVLPSTTWAYWVWSPDQGKFINPQGTIEDSAEEQFNFSMEFYNNKNYKRAEDEFKNLLKQFPASRAASEALYYLGNLHEAANNYYKAFKDYQKIVDDYPQSERINEVVERQFHIGELYMTGKKEKLLGLPVIPSVYRAVEVFEKIVETSPYSAYGDQAQFKLAQAYRMTRNWQKAQEAYQKLIDNYPDSELVDDAKFQMAESMFLMSNRPDRDQRGLETASQNFDQFLKEYPSSPIAQKAVQLKQAIDSQAAEKNFKVGEYYEKDNYIESALIYYEDVVRTFPDSQWGKRAQDKILKLREPAKFLEQRQSLLESKRRDLEARERALEEKEALLRTEKDEALEKKLKEEQKKIKEFRKTIESEAGRFEKNKKDSIKLRRKALERDKAELARKEKVLAARRKLLQKNASKDLERILNRWMDGLEAERYSLYRQETDIIKLEEQFGIRRGAPGVLRFIPFLPRQETLSTIIQYKVKDFSELARKWEEIKKEKSALFDERRNLEIRLAGAGPWNLEMIRQNEALRKELQSRNPQLANAEAALALEEKEFAGLTEKQADLEAQLKKLSGSLVSKVGGVVTAPVALAAVPAGIVGSALGGLNPFKDAAVLRGEDRLVELLREKEKLEKAMEQKKSIIQAIQTAFEEELASDLVQADARIEEKAKEEEKPAQEEAAFTELSGDENLKPAIFQPDLTMAQKKEIIGLKREIKRVEREIRRRYEEIEDRKENKAGKLDQLAKLLQTRQNRGLLGPVGGTAKEMGRWAHIFLFGMKSEEWEMSNKARKIQDEGGEESVTAAALRESIELDNIMIEARGREIKEYKQELNGLKAKGKTVEGFSFRSIIFERPGNMIQDAIEEASQMIPQKDKKSVLVGRLDAETRALAELESKWAAAENALKTMTAEAKEAEKKVIETPVVEPQQTITSSPWTPQAPIATMNWGEHEKKQIPETAVEDAGKEEKIARLSQEISDLKLLVENKNRRVSEMRASLESSLRDWAEKNGWQVPGVSKKAKKKLQKSRKKLANELKEVDRELGELIANEKELLKKQQSLYQDKLRELEKAIANMKKRADDRYELLLAEKQSIAVRLEQNDKNLASMGGEEKTGASGSKLEVQSPKV